MLVAHYWLPALLTYYGHALAAKRVDPDTCVDSVAREHGLLGRGRLLCSAASGGLVSSSDGARN